MSATSHWPDVKEHLLEKDICAILRSACISAGSQRAWADAHDLSPAFVSDVLQGKRAVTDRIASVLGYTRFVGFYEKQAREPLNDK